MPGSDPVEGWDLASWRLAARLCAGCDPWERPRIRVVPPIWHGMQPTSTAGSPYGSAPAVVTIPEGWVPDYRHMTPEVRRYLLTYRIR